MRWFQHDSNAHTDAKIKRLRHKYGMIGYGLYWYCLELIASKLDRNNVTFELEDDAELIAMDWGLDQLKVEEMMRYMVEITLFESSNNTITCLKIAERLDDTNSRNPEIRKIINNFDLFSNSSDNPEDSSGLSEDSSDRSDQIRSDQTTLETTKKKKTFFEKPTINEIKEYCQTRINNIDAEKFWHFYESKNWMVGKTKMKSWKSCVITWEKRDSGANANKAPTMIDKTTDAFKKHINTNS